MGNKQVIQDLPLNLAAYQQHLNEDHDHVLAYNETLAQAKQRHLVLHETRNDEHLHVPPVSA